MMRYPRLAVQDVPIRGWITQGSLAATNSALCLEALQALNYNIAIY
jgi:hypothetical protein